MKINGKKFIFGIVAILCVTVSTCLLNYDVKIYIWLVSLISSIFTAGQTITDTIKRRNGGV